MRRLHVALFGLLLAKCVIAPVGMCQLAQEPPTNNVAQALEVDQRSNSGVQRAAVDASPLVDIAWRMTPLSPEQCVSKVKLPNNDSLYLSALNLGRFIVGVDGVVLLRPRQPIDENDMVEVYIVGDSTNVAATRVRRISAFRKPGQAPILGDEVLSQTKYVTREETEPAEHRCLVKIFRLTDFAAGKGEVELSRGGGKDATKEAFDFAVNPLYSGALTLGPVISRLQDHLYEVMADSTVALVRGESPGGRYIVSYTHFIWGRRDIEKESAFGRPNVNPFIAMSIDKPRENVLAGIAVDFLRASVYMHLGVHGAEVTRLNSAEGLAIGDRLPSGASAVPTRQVWAWDWFYGVSLDLRAATKLLGQAISGGSSK